MRVTLRDLHVEIEIIKSKQEAMEKDLAEIKSELKRLTEIMQIGRGVWFAVMKTGAVVAAIGTLGSVILHQWRGK